MNIVGGRRIEVRGQRTEDRGQKKFSSVFFLLFSVFCFLSSVISGCGYTTRSMSSNKFRSIYVTPFVNKIDFTQENYAGNKYKIYKPSLETDITKGVINKFITDGNLKIEEKQSADLVLTGELTEFRRDPLKYTGNDDVEEYRLNLVVNMSLWDNRENRVIWKEKGFTGDTSYFTIGAQATSEDIAINNAVKDLARRIVERAVDQW